LRLALRIGALTAALSAAAFVFERSAPDVPLYKEVDEVVAEHGRLSGKSLVVHGCVVAGSVIRDEDAGRYWFALRAHDRIMPAAYEGLVPDTFVEGNEVIVRARLEDGRLQVAPDGIMARCGNRLPSKEACPY
jgi:cytochrome c-type biogenesis protein CcmE